MRNKATEAWILWYAARRIRPFPLPAGAWRFGHTMYMPPLT